MPMPATSISLRKSLDISIPPKTFPLLGHSVLLRQITVWGSNRFLFYRVGEPGLEGPVSAFSADAELTAPPAWQAYPPAAPHTRPTAEGRLPSRSSMLPPRPLPAAPNAHLRA